MKMELIIQDFIQKKIYKSKKMSFKYFILFILIILPNTLLSEDFDDRIKHHIIVSVDWSPAPSVEDWKRSSETRDAVCNMFDYTVVDGIGNKRKILDSGDYYSCVGFRTCVDHANLQQYVSSLSMNNHKIEFESYKPNIKNYFSENWNTWLGSISMSQYSTYSLLTISKPYCLSHFSKFGKSHDVNRTFMIVVSDHVYNGDFYGEVTNWRQHHEQNFGEAISDKDVFPLCYAVNQYYYIRFLTSVPIMNNNNYAPKGYVDLYEFVPLQKNFYMGTVLDFPKVIKAKRVRGDKYSCDINILNRNHPSYEVLQLRASINNEIIKSSKESRFDISDTVNCKFEVSGDKSVKSLNLKAWIRLSDGVYNSTILSPSPFATVESGRNGLDVNIPVEYEEKAKLLFMPFPDFLWFDFLPDNQYDAALIWRIFILIVMVIALSAFIISLFKSKQYFTPNIGEIKIIVKKNK